VFRKIIRKVIQNERKMIEQEIEREKESRLGTQSTENDEEKKKKNEVEKQ
jgi:hypothetical protein